MIYVYAITESRALAPRGAGLDGAPLELLQAECITAVHSTHAEFECSPEPESLWCHQLVIEELMRAGPVLPTRFGSTFSDSGALAVVLAREAPRLREQLERVRGCVELAVRVGLPELQRPQPIDGRAYLSEKLAVRRGREVAAQRTLAPLRELAVQCRQSEHGSDTGSLVASYLVRESEVARFADQVRRLQANNRKLVLSCTGPWAPYSFVGQGVP